MLRQDGRQSFELRPIEFTVGHNAYAEGSVLGKFGNTIVSVTASVEQEIPKWMSKNQGGWITAEYSMLPRATHTRNKREASNGKQSGRTLEIQRLIGRALRQSIDLNALPGISIIIDCDVLQADGGTRTASITTGWIALHQAITFLKNQNLIEQTVELSPIAALSVGSINEKLVLDLNYAEDSTADSDVNIVFNQSLEIIEIQGTSEKKPLKISDLQRLLEESSKAIKTIFELQKSAITIK